MPPTVKVKASDSLVKREREEIAQRVLAQFGDSLADCRLLCFFDDEDWQQFKLDMGEDNRAFHTIISDSTRFTGWPKYITDYILVGPSSFFRKRVFDQVVYLHGSACADSVGMIMSFAHELQHVIQRVNVPELLTANGLFRHLPKTVLQNVGLLQWSDIPTEREARAEAKKIAVTLCGSEAVNEFLEQRAASAKDPVDLADVLFIQGLDASAPYILRDETLKLFGRFKNYRAELESLIDEFRLDPDFEPVQLDSFMPPVIPNSKQ
jgi:hypothetical protein